MDIPETPEPAPVEPISVPAPAADEAVPLPLATGGVVSAPVTLPSESGCTYRFTYRDTTVYPEHGLVAEPGDIHDWPDGPPTDGRWTLATEGE